MSSLTAASIDTVLPALRQIGHDLGVANPLSTQLVVTTFILGMVVGDPSSARSPTPSAGSAPSSWASPSTWQAA
ncbi:MAG: hypothetical protein R3C69_09345 [Geminicoccaceae bacterium]